MTARQFASQPASREEMPEDFTPMSEQQSWAKWFDANKLPDLEKLLHNLFPKPGNEPDWTIDKWQPSDEDKAFAWEMYVELRTRISAQPLHFLSGDEATALDSLFRLFQIVRDLEKKHGVGGFVSASLTSFVLNSDIRPVTARWHKMKLEGKLHPEDLRREFRTTLLDLQPKLRAFQKLLLRIAGVTHDDGSDDELSNVRYQEARDLGQSIPFDRLLGYECTCKVPREKIIEIVAAETREIQDRRDAVKQIDNVGTPGDKPPEHIKELIEALKTGEQKRENKQPYLPVNDVVGLAISGGGIRSATFALGVLQGLTQRDIFKQVDLVSTVSGGGYLGSFLSTYLNTDNPNCGPTIENAPFKPEVAGDSLAIRSLRNHSRYVQPKSFEGWLTTLGQVAYGIVSNLIILSFWIFMAVLATFLIRTELQDIWRDIYSPKAMVATSANAKIDIRLTPVGDSKVPPIVIAAETQTPPKQAASDSSISTDGEAAKPTFDYWKLTGLTKVGIAITVALVFLLPLFQRKQFRRDPFQAKVQDYEKLTIAFVVSMAGIIAIDQLPAAHYGYIRFMKWISESVLTVNSDARGWSLTASIVTIGNVVGMLIARAQWLRNLVNSFPLLGRGLFLLLWLCGPLLCAYIYFELCRVYIADPNAGLFLLGIPVLPQVLIMLLAAGSFFYSYMCNVNFTSLHRFYRNRLCETYLLSHVESGEPQVKPFQKLSELRQHKRSTAPYHLLNGALNLPGSEIDDLRGRNCDFFLFSKHVCGCPVIGYSETEQWQLADPHLDLGTALAISGAAAAPQMGMGSIKGASFLMTLLNVRMAYWLLNPMHKDFRPNCPSTYNGPGPLYLAKEALNRMDQESPYLNVSDGGHLENLAIYELLRRRCKFMIAIDGEHDPELTFPSLRRLQRFAEVDLGVTIDMDVERIEWDLPSIFQPSDKGERLVEDKAADRRRPEPIIQRFSRGHFAVGRISYPEVEVPLSVDELAETLKQIDPDDPLAKVKEAEIRERTKKVPVTGWLLYIKLSITGNEPDYIHDYRREHPDFPHQTTNDQVFEEDQFEAYRALGEHVSGDLFADEIVANCPNAKNALDQSFEVHDWFQGLATAMCIRL